MINAFAKVGNVEGACAWLQCAEELDKGLDGVAYSCVINACGKAGAAERAMEVFEQLRARGIQSHIVINAALARHFAYQGDSDKVEEIAEMMSLNGIAMYDYLLYTKLVTYTRSKPKELRKAEMVFLQGVESGVQYNERITKVLTSISAENGMKFEHNDFGALKQLAACPHSSNAVTLIQWILFRIWSVLSLSWHRSKKNSSSGLKHLTSQRNTRMA